MVYKVCHKSALVLLSEMENINHVTVQLVHLVKIYFHFFFSPFHITSMVIICSHTNQLMMELIWAATIFPVTKTKVMHIMFLTRL